MTVFIAFILLSSLVAVFILWRCAESDLVSQREFTEKVHDSMASYRESSVNHHAELLKLKKTLASIKELCEERQP